MFVPHRGSASVAVTKFHKSTIASKKPKIRDSLISSAYDLGTAFPHHKEIGDFQKEAASTQISKILTSHWFNRQ